MTLLIKKDTVKITGRKSFTEELEIIILEKKNSRNGFIIYITVF